MTDKGKHHDLQKKCAYLTTRVAETEKELARLDHLNLSLTREKKQFFTAFTIINVIEKEIHKAFTVENLFRNITATITKELCMDWCAIFEVDTKNRSLSVLASSPTRRSEDGITVPKRISIKAIATSTFASSDSTVKPFHRFLQTSFGFPYFAWCPVSVKGTKLVSLFLANKREDVMVKHPFSAVRLKAFEAIASALSLRMDTISKTQKILGKKEEKIAFLAEVLKTAPVSVIVTDPQMAITYVNPATEKLYGYKAKELVGKNPIILNALTDSSELEKEIIYTADRNKVWKGELLNRKKNGELVHIDASIYQLLDKKGACMAWVGFQIDITQRKILEDQLRQSQKMEAIGRLAGGIAHDFNNILTGIIGYLQLMQTEIDFNNPLQEDFNEVLKLAHRATSLTSRLLTFSRRQTMRLTVFDINEDIADLSKMIQRLVGENIHVHLALDPDVGLLNADKNQIEQVIMNLVVNAKDAMPNGGNLTIETTVVTLNGEFIHDRMRSKPGQYIMIAVSDTGVGMDKTTLEHSLEPFFTTKDVGKGTGLGLPTAYGIVKKHNGYIWIYSEPGKGTTIKLYFPKPNAHIQPQPKTTPKKSAHGKGKTVLVVEDEEYVANVIHRILTNYGYEVLTELDPRNALANFATYRDKTVLLISDVTMPGMNGKQLYDSLLAFKPDLKVLYMSGYTDNAIAHHGVFDENIVFLQKPFSPEGLLEKINEALQE